MFSYYSYSKKGVVKKIDSLDSINYKKNSDFLWVDLINPKKEDLEKIKNKFDFHPLSIEDCENFSDLPKVEEFENYLFIIFHKIYYDIKKDKIILKKINFFVGTNYIVSIHKENYPAIDKIKELIEKNPNIMQKGPDFFLHLILDNIVDDYFPLIDYWEKEINKIEDYVIDGAVRSHHHLLNRIIRLRKDLNELKRSIAPQTNVINKLVIEDFKFISKKTHFYFRDVHDHISKIDSSLKNNIDLVMSLLDAYLSTVSNKMNENSNKMNLIMQKLTLVSTIFLPLTFIASVYGMNFKYMPELNITLAYPIIMIFMLGIAIWMYVFFKKKHLL